MVRSKWVGVPEVGGAIVLVSPPIEIHQIRVNMHVLVYGHSFVTSLICAGNKRRPFFSLSLSLYI